MCTVAQLIEQLQKYPVDAIVEAKQEYSSGYETCVGYAPVDVEYFESCILDYRSEDNCKKYPSLAGKVFIQLDTI